MNIHQANDDQRILSVFNAMPSALLLVNEQYSIQLWNDAMVAWTNVATTLAVGKKLNLVFPALIDYTYLIDQTFASKKDQHLANAIIIINPNDLHKIYQITAYPITVGSCIEVAIRIDDVTAQARYDANLAQVEKLASIGASLAGVAHEINNPLAVIAQSAQNVARRMNTSLEANVECAKRFDLNLPALQNYLEQREVYKFIKMITSEAERAAEIVKNMLSYTRKNPQQMVGCDLFALIEDSIRLAEVESSILRKGNVNKVKIIKEFHNRQFNLKCRTMEIQQVVVNILKNAIQAINANTGGEIVIDVSHDHVAAIIQISDNGPGIEPEIIKHIFEPFFTTKGIGVGTGLGLSICKNIIDQHRGIITVDSKIGKGTTFTIRLPI